MTPPNVILIQADDHGTLDAGCYGSADLLTPALDALAARGTRFTQAYGHTVCCPSRAALLTGRYPQRCGINDWCSNHPSDERGVGVASNAVTLASMLRSRGYRTGLFGKWHLGSRPGSRPRDCGFDEFFGHLGGFIDNYSHQFLHAKPEQPPFHDLWENEAEVFSDGRYFPDLVTERALRFLEQEYRRPFYLHVAPNLPHYPYQPDVDLAEACAHLPEPRASYAAMVATLDRRVGQILEAVDRLGLRERTLVCYTSDHGHSTEDFANWGESYGARGGGGDTGPWRGAKGSFLEGGIRVPTILSLPGTIPAGEVRNQLVTNMDVMPTILAACGVPEPGADGVLDGRSLWPILNDSTARTPYETLCLQWQDRWMVREGDWKLLFNGVDTTGQHSRHPEGNRELGRWHLASLVADPPEVTNFTAAKPEITARLREAYEHWAVDVLEERCPVA
ncbi:sulfatase-like hydrolase/transferase [Gaiella sp.]|uniref:sulfatase family protein n=1 Tax=Gaiella sp. TaxID=2663207 RepID=UPI0032633D69